MRAFRASTRAATPDCSGSCRRRRSAGGRCRVRPHPGRRGCRTAVEGCDLAFRLAALIAISSRIAARADYLKTNARFPQRRAGHVAWATLGIIQHVVIEVYGGAQTVPIWSHIRSSASRRTRRARSARTTSWRAFPRLCVPATVLRPFNTYGPRQSCTRHHSDDHHAGCRGSVIHRVAVPHARLHVRDRHRRRLPCRSWNRSTQFGSRSGSGPAAYSISDLVARRSDASHSTLFVEQEDQRTAASNSEVIRLVSDGLRSSQRRSMDGHESNSRPELPRPLRGSKDHASTSTMPPSCCLDDPGGDPRRRQGTRLRPYTMCCRSRWCRLASARSSN